MTIAEIKALIIDKINPFTARGMKYVDVRAVLNSLADFLDLSDGRISALETRMTAEEAVGSANTTAIAATNLAVDNLAILAASLSGLITDLQAQVDALVAEEGDNEAAISDLQDQIDATNATIIIIQGQIAALQAAVAGNSVSITNIQTAATALAATVVSIGNRLTIAEANIATNSSAITALNSSITAINLSITSLQAADTAFNTRLNTDEANITLNTANIASNTAAIATNAAAIATETAARIAGDLTDYQTITITNQTVTSATFVAIPILTRTTKNMGAATTYLIDIVAFVTGSAALGSTMQFRFNNAGSADNPITIQLAALGGANPMFSWTHSVNNSGGVAFIRGDALVSSGTLTFVTARMRIRGFKTANQAP